MCAVLTVCQPLVSKGSEQDDGGPFAVAIAPFLINYCNQCHGDEEPEGNLTLGSYKNPAVHFKDRDVPGDNRAARRSNAIRHGDVCRPHGIVKGRRGFSFALR